MKCKSIKEFQDLIDSDDELPDDHVETPYVPAFYNDDRFTNIRFNLSNIGRNVEEPLGYKHDKFLRKGIMSSKDIFCSKCIEMSDGSTLLWFVNFILLKDLQSNYKFLKSCLVPQIQQNDDTEVCNVDNKDLLKYKLVIN